MVEQHDKQFTEAAAARADQHPKKASVNKPDSVTSPGGPPKQRQSKPVEASPQQPLRLCHACQQPGHYARHFPERNKKEAPGRSTAKVASRTSCLAAEVTKLYDDLSDEQLESILAQWTLRGRLSSTQSQIVLSCN